MMKKNILSMCYLLTMTCSSAFAASAPDASTKPNEYYLLYSQVPDSFALLPEPPRIDSIEFLRDKAIYEATKILRNTPQGKQAYLDGNANSEHLLGSFSDAFGMTISPKSTPAIFIALANMQQDAGEIGTRSAKKQYNRIRPYTFFNEQTCRPEDQFELSENGSYPSGHATVGWAFALVLAEINPDRQNEILKRGLEFGQSRVICGFHWQSDVDAARILASGVVARLHADASFIEKLNSAKTEFTKLKQNRSASSNREQK